MEAEKQRLIDLENDKQKRKTDRDVRALKRKRRYDPSGTVYEEDKPTPKPSRAALPDYSRAASPVYRPGTPEYSRPMVQRPKLPDNMLPGNSSNSAYRLETFKERLTKFYERVNPENVVKIPSILEKYKNTFELLSRKLLKKYPKQWKHVIWHNR